MDYLVRELRTGDPDDAARLAAMWNASDAGWPGGWNRGVPETAENIRERKERQHRLAVFVCQAGDEIIGHADLKQSRQGVALLPLLNVRPDWHSRGCGKALILAVLDRAIALGYEQLELGTWAGNLKAVPLYKKTGFFWRPETTVHMQNFIPTALAAPLGKSFFAAHPWYQSFRRELEVAPDEVRWHGVRVYPYRFECDGSLFAMWIDHIAERATAYETEHAYVACYIGQEEVVCGVDQTVTWEVVNKRPEQPLQAAILARGSEGLAINVSETARVCERWVCSRTFNVSPQIPLVRPGRPQHSLRSTVLLDGVPVELAAGVRAVQPVELEQAHGPLVPGKRERVRLTLRNRLDHDVRVEVGIAPRPGLVLDPMSAPVEVPAKSWTSLDLSALATEEGDLSSSATIRLTRKDNPDLPLSAETVALRPRPLGFATVPLTRSFHVHDPESESLRVETPELSLRFWLRGCHGSVRSPLVATDLLYLRATQLGPPFQNWEPVPELTDWRFSEEHGAVALTLIDRPSAWPGLRVEKTYRMAGSRLRVTHRVFNETGATHRLTLRVPAWANCHEAIAVPLRSGLLHEVLGEGLRTTGGRDIPKTTAEFEESWLAMEGDGVVAGVVWTEAAECNGLDLQIELPELPPHGAVEAPPFYYIVGVGNWGHVRRVWRWLEQPAEVREEVGPAASPALEARFDPAPLLLTEATTCRLRIYNRRAQVMDLRWQATSNDLVVEPSSGQIGQVDRQHPAEVPLHFAPSGPRSAAVSIRLEEQALRRAWELPVVVIGQADSAVEVAHDNDLVRVDNGRMCFAVSGAHYGSIVSLTYGGLERLASSYPEPRPFRWFNPWYGGIVPQINWPGDGRFLRLAFMAEPIERRGTRGLLWRGVRVACEVDHRDYTWLRCELDYLTIGGSNLLCVAQRAVNKVAAPRWIELGIGVWTTSARAVHYEVERPRYGVGLRTTQRIAGAEVRGITADGFGSRSGRWAGVETADGLVITAVAAAPGSASTGGDVSAEGEESSGLNSRCGFSLEPNETRERLHWVVMAADASQAELYQCLAELVELP